MLLYVSRVAGVKTKKTVHKMLMLLLPYEHSNISLMLKNKSNVQAKVPFDNAQYEG